MIKNKRIIPALIMAAAVSFTGCANNTKLENSKSSTVQNTTKSGQEAENKSQTTVQENTVKENEPKVPESIDLEKVKPNEAGKVMVVMFHNFIETYKSGDKEYTTTFDDFGKLLQTLYDKGYRLINMNDYINNNINVPAGYIPMVFTFDDGTAGQFNLVEEGGKLVANKQSAVGVMEEFANKHPDFGLKGTFYVNLGDNTFIGKGTLAERLKYLTDKGFEVGNHTLNHIDLRSVKTADKVMEQVGGNQKAMEGLIPGYKLNSLALPLGHSTKEDNIRGYIAKGEYQGMQYENKAIMLVGANPAPSPVSTKFNPLSTPRVRATGIKAVECDLAWWLDNISRKEQFVSDGNPETVSVPKDKEANVDKQRVGSKKLVVY